MARSQKTQDFGTVKSETFTYVAVSATGQKVKNVMVAPSAGAVVTALSREGWIPLEVTPAKNQAMNLDITAFITGGGVKFKWAQRSEFARRLNQMLRAGISVPKALQSLGEDAPGPVAEMCNSMAEKVMAGQALSEAMAEHPRAFDDVTVAYIQAGEESGTLVQTTERLAIMLNKRAALQSKIKGVSAYPKMVGGSILVLVIGIITFLVPMYAKIYKSFNAPLPKPTLMLMWVAGHFSPIGLGKASLGSFTIFYPSPHPISIGMFILLIVAAVIFFRKKTKKNLEIGRKMDRILFRLPLVGALAHKQTLQRWATTLSGALASGVPITRAIDLAAMAAGSRWHQWLAPSLKDAVRTGRSMSSEISKVPELYPPNVRTMMSTGEDTGELDSMLDSVAEALDSDIDSIVAGLSAKVEVALLLVLGGVVGGLLLVLYMPILNLATTASKGLGG